MTYRKFKADYLFTGREMADRGSVLITTEDGTVQDIIPFSEAGEDIRHLKGLLSPGFINCHCHLELSHLKGVLPERKGLVDFLLAVMQQRNSQAPGSSSGKGPGEVITAGSAGLPATPGWIQAAIADAETFMLDNGIVAVGDICNTTHSLIQKTGSRLYYHNFIETMGFVEQSAPDRFESSRKIFDAFAAVTTTPAGTSLVPHAPYSVSSRLFGMIAGFSGNHLLTIHNQESEAENEFYRSGQGDFLRLYRAMGLDTSFFHGTGKRSLESYLPYFFSPATPGRKDGRRPDGSRQSLILVHNVATSEEDLQFALNGQAGSRQDDTIQPMKGHSSPDLYFCLCPNANLYIGGELPDIALLMRRNCVLVIGTDSLASNHQLSILEELKTLQRLLPQLPTPTLLKWATANGAEALQADGMLGSFAPGKKPGIVLIEGLDEDKFTAGSAARRLL